MNRKLDKMKKKHIIYMVCILVFICYYLYFTCPIELVELMKQDEIRYIDMFIPKTDSSQDIEDHIELTNTEKINELIDVLNRYKYSRKFKYNNSRVVTANTTPVIDLMFGYYNADDRFRFKHITVFSNNTVKISNEKMLGIEYKIRDNESVLFDDLIMWIRQR